MKKSSPEIGGDCPKHIGAHVPHNSITTQHLANIFSIKFLQDEHLIATGAADGQGFKTTPTLSGFEIFSNANHHQNSTCSEGHKFLLFLGKIRNCDFRENLI